MFRGFALRSLALLGLVAVLGCGASDEPKSVPVSGKITKGGLVWSLTEELAGATLPPGDKGGTVMFISKGAVKEQSGVEYNAALNSANGSFTVPGPFGKGLPPGEYDLVVYVGVFGAGGKSGIPGGGGIPGKAKGNNSMHGKEVGRKAVIVPDGGITDIVLDLAK